MIAYHGNPELKAAVVAEAIGHREADQYRRGFYWKEDEQKGCSVGCMLKSADHSLSESKWGIPCVLTYLQDSFFENTPTEYSNTWTERYFEAIPVGADLQLVSWQFLFWVLTEGLVLDDSGGASLQSAINICRREIAKCAAAIKPLTRGSLMDRDLLRFVATTTEVAAEAANTESLAAVDQRDFLIARNLSSVTYAVALAIRPIAILEDCDCSSVVFGAVGLNAAYEHHLYLDGNGCFTLKTSKESHYVKMAEKLLELLAATSVSDNLMLGLCEVSITQDKEREIE